MTDSRIRAVVFLLGFAALLIGGLWWVQTIPPSPPRPLPCPAGTKCFSPAEAREVFIPLGPEWSEWYLLHIPPGGDWSLAAPSGTYVQVFGKKEVRFDQWGDDGGDEEPYIRVRNPREGSAILRAK